MGSISEHSIQQSSAPAMGSRISSPSRTTRAMLSPDDEDASADDETDTCTEASFLDLFVGDGLFKISTWPPRFIRLPEWKGQRRRSEEAVPPALASMLHNANTPAECRMQIPLWLSRRTEDQTTPATLWRSWWHARHQTCVQHSLTFRRAHMATCSAKRA